MNHLSVNVTGLVANFVNAQQNKSRGQRGAQRLGHSYPSLIPGTRHNYEVPLKALQAFVLALLTSTMSRQTTHR